MSIINKRDTNSKSFVKSIELIIMIKIDNSSTLFYDLAKKQGGGRMKFDLNKIMAIKTKIGSTVIEI